MFVTNGKYLKSFYPHHGRVFLLSTIPALWNAKPIPLGSAESKKQLNLSVLCVSAVNYYDLGNLKTAFTKTCQNTPTFKSGMNGIL